MNLRDILRSKPFQYGLLAGILALALYLRLANLARVQVFMGDQSVFYFAIMDWKQDGLWPLLGPWRGMGGDRTIGPGWYYVIAPALWLSDFSPIAGAVQTAFLGALNIFLGWWWVRRTTGSALAALATAAVFAFSTAWVASDRMLWNPNMLPLSAVALACLIEWSERRAVPALALFLMLVAIIPHWHTAGIPMIIAALPLMALALARARGRFGEASRRSWLLWGALLALVVALYLPPIIHELRPGPGNLGNYLHNTMLPGPPPVDPLYQRMIQSADRVIGVAFRQAFFPGRLPLRQPSLWVGAGLAVLGFLLVYGRLVRRNWRSVPLSPVFLALLVGGFWWIVVLKSGKLLDYFLHPMVGAPVLLAGWTAGRLLEAREGSSRLERGALRAAGLFMVALGLSLTVAQLPRARAVHAFHPAQEFNFRDSRAIASYIAQDAADTPFSLIYIDRPENSTLYLHVLTRIAGARSLNSRVSLRQPFRHPALGERIYIVTRGGMSPTPVFNGPVIALGAPIKVGDAVLYRVPTASLPANFASIQLSGKGREWQIHVKTTP